MACIDGTTITKIVTLYNSAVSASDQLAIQQAQEAAMQFNAAEAAICALRSAESIAANSIAN